MKPPPQPGESLTVLAALKGKVVAYGPKMEPSAFVKRAVAGPVTVGERGIEGDEQADRVNHGGADKAVLHYPHDHYAKFISERPALAPVFAHYGAFGENVSTEGWTEWDVCIGDRFRLGTAEVEISQARSPCWKLGHRFRDQAMVEAVVKTRRGGWYYRVLRPGQFATGDAFELLDRQHPDWTVARAFGIIVAGDDDPAGLGALAEMDRLASAWREKAAGLLARSA